MAKRGRPTKYTPELAKEICDRIANGETFRMLDADPKLPCTSTIIEWIADPDKKDFAKQYENAKYIQAKRMFDDLLHIADEGQKNKEDVMRSRLRVDTRKWYLSKVLPKIYGDKLDLTSDGKALPTPIYGGTSVSEHLSHKEDIQPDEAD